MNCYSYICYLTFIKHLLCTKYCFLDLELQIVRYINHTILFETWINKGGGQIFQDMTSIQCLLDSWNHWKLSPEEGALGSYGVKELDGWNRWTIFPLHFEWLESSHEWYEPLFSYLPSPAHWKNLFYFFITQKCG